MQAPKLPFAVRALNAAGGTARALGVPLGRLDADALLTRARKTAGLDDYGADEIAGPTLGDPLARLVESLEIMAGCLHPELFGELVERHAASVRRVSSDLSPAPFAGR